MGCGVPYKVVIENSSTYNSHRPCNHYVESSWLGLGAVVSYHLVFCSKWEATPNYIYGRPIVHFKGRHARPRIINWSGC